MGVFFYSSSGLNLEHSQSSFEVEPYTAYFRHSKNYFQVVPADTMPRSAEEHYNVLRFYNDWLIIFNKIYNIINTPHFDFENIDKKTSDSFFKNLGSSFKDNNIDIANKAMNCLNKYNLFNLRANPLTEEWVFPQAHATEQECFVPSCQRSQSHNTFADDVSISSDSVLEESCKNISALKALFNYNRKTSNTPQKHTSSIPSTNLICTLAELPDDEVFKFPIIRGLLNSRLHKLAFIDSDFYISLYNESVLNMRSLLMISLLEPEGIFVKIQDYWKKYSYFDLQRLYTGNIAANILSEFSNNYEDIPYGNLGRLLKLINTFAPETLSYILWNPYSPDDNYFMLSRFITYFYENDFRFFLEHVRKHIDVNAFQKMMFLDGENSIIQILHHSPHLMYILLNFLDDFYSDLRRSLYVYRRYYFFDKLKPFFLMELDNNVLKLILNDAETLFSKSFFIDKLCLKLCLAGNQNISIILSEIKSLDSKNLKTFILKHKLKLLKSTWKNVENLYRLLNKARAIKDNFYTFHQLIKAHKKIIKSNKRFYRMQGADLNLLISILKKNDFSALEFFLTNLILNNEFKTYMLAFPNERGENLLLIAAEYANVEALTFIINAIKRYDTLLWHLFLFYDNRQRNVFYYAHDEDVIRVLENTLRDFGGNLLQKLKGDRGETK